MKYKLIGLFLLSLLQQILGSDALSPVKKIVGSNHFRFDPYAATCIPAVNQGVSAIARTRLESHIEESDRRASQEHVQSFQQPVVTGSIQEQRSVSIIRILSRPQGILQNLLDTSHQNNFNHLLAQKYFSQEILVKDIVDISKEFSRYTNMQEAFEKLEILLSRLECKDRLNAYNARGQTLAHRVVVQARLPLIQCLAQGGLDFTKRTRKPDKFVGSTPVHILAGILHTKFYAFRKSKTLCYEPYILGLQSCLTWLLKMYPEIKTMRSGNSNQTVQDLLSRSGYERNGRLIKELSDIEHVVPVFTYNAYGLGNHGLTHYFHMKLTR